MFFFCNFSFTIINKINIVVYIFISVMTLAIQFLNKCNKRFKMGLVIEKDDMLK